MRGYVAILAVGLLAAGCGSSAGSASPGSSAPPTALASSAPSGSKYAVETGADQLILRIADEGGFVGPGWLLTRVPEFALYGDGTVIVPGPVDTIYPGPLLPNLRRLSVTPAEIEKILAAAETAGLLGPDASYNLANITDTATTVFTTIVGGRTHTVSAYALGEAAFSPVSSDAAPRAKLLAFRNEMGDLAAFLGRPIDDASYEPAGLRVFSSPAQTAGTASPTPQTLTWPLATDPATAGGPTRVPGIRCIVLTGSDLGAFLVPAAKANVATVWTAASGRYNISVRPLYPDETGCPAPAP